MILFVNRLLHARQPDKKDNMTSNQPLHTHENQGLPARRSGSVCGCTPPVKYHSTRLSIILPEFIALFKLAA
jgi:hypothetical protein